jgi:hypothetical protein
MAKALALPLLLLALARGVGAADEAAEPTADALAAAWLEQRFGGDAVEIWRTTRPRRSWSRVARRWQGAKPEVRCAC